MAVIVLRNLHAHSIGSISAAIFVAIGIGAVAVNINCGRRPHRCHWNAPVAAAPPGRRPAVSRGGEVSGLWCIVSYCTRARGPGARQLSLPTGDFAQFADGGLASLPTGEVAIDALLKTESGDD